MSVINLSWWELALASLLVLALAMTSHFARLGMVRSLLVAATRTVIQLALVGLVLEVVFELGRLLWIALMSLIMLLVAGREVMARQKYRLTGGWAFGIGTLAAVSAGAGRLFDARERLRLDRLSGGSD